MVELFQSIQNDFGGVDGCINNAGVTSDGLLVKVTDGKVQTKLSVVQFNKVIAVDLMGVFLCGREAAAQMIEGGRGGVIAAGGRWGYRLGDGQLYDSMLRDGLNDAFSGEHSGWHTEDLAKSCEITREMQDCWALRSQQRFSAEQAAGKFKDKITPVEVHGHKGPKIFDKDEHNRPDTSIEGLASFALLSAGTERLQQVTRRG